MDAIFKTLEELSEKLKHQEMQLEKMKEVSPICFSNKSDYAKRFREMNEQGAMKHGFSYINASEAAISVADDFGLNIDRPEIKALISCIVVKILDNQ